MECYALDQLGKLITIPRERCSTFICPLTVLCHDIGFSRTPARLRRAICVALSPVTWIGHALRTSDGAGTETASARRKPGDP